MWVKIGNNYYNDSDKYVVKTGNNYYNDSDKYVGYEIQSWGKAYGWAVVRNNMLLATRPTFREAKVLAAYHANGEQ